MAFQKTCYPFKIKGTYPPVNLGKITPRQYAAADRKGFVILGRGGSDRQMIILGCRACGQPLERRSNVVEHHNIECKTCIQREDEAAALKLGGELLSPRAVGHRHLREWRLTCGHIVTRQRSNMRKAARGANKAGCETCREERYASEAAKHGWTLLEGLPDKPGYRRYRHGCGTIQTASVGNVLWGDIACQTCGEGPTARPSYIYIFQIDLPDLPVVKLGFSRKPRKRLRHQLGIAKGVKTKILRTIPMPTGFVAREEETAAHKALHAHHPDWVVPKTRYADAINTAGEIYYPAALPRIHALLDDISARWPATDATS